MRIRCLYFWIVLLLAFPNILPGQMEDSSNISIFVFPPFYIETLPGAYFYPTFFENFAPDTTVLIEENNGFSLVDSPRIYFEGDSFTDFRWYLNGFSINSALQSGAPSVLLPLSSINQYELRGESPLHRDYGLNFISASPGKNFFKIWISNVWPHMGSYIPGATDFVNPHPTSEDRNKLLYSERRQILSNYFVDLTLGQKFKSSVLSLSLTFFDVERQFNDFSIFDETFVENGKLFLVKSEYQKAISSGFFGIAAVYNALSRDRDGAELGRLPQETFDKDKQSFFSGFHLKKKRLDFRFSYSYEKENLAPSQMNFLKDLKDNDGEGFFPYEKWGLFSGNIFRLTLDSAYPFEQYINTEIRLFADLKYATIKGNEESFEFNPISFDQSPYLVLLWKRGKEYSNSNAFAKAGTIFQASLSKYFSVYTKLLVQYSSLRFFDSGNNLSSLAFGYDLGIQLAKNSLNVLLAYERMPYEIGEDVNFFLEKQRPWGTYYFWNDSNQDLTYQAGEEGGEYGFTGGQFHSLDEDIATPFKKRLLLSFSTRLSEKFSLNVKSILKTVSNNFWVKFKDEHGFYETVGDKKPYFYSEPFTDYALSNYTFDEEPFYFQFLLHVQGQETQKWFFSFSFLAHLGMGYTAFGNGPGANDFGLLDESQAHPNTWINGYGRVDGDRAYVGKMYFGFYIAKNLFVAVNFKYRDGNPFAFIGSSYAYNQRVFFLETIQAENKKGIKGGPREDYLSDVSVKMRYDFRLSDWKVSISGGVFNLLDFGSELSEYVFSGGKRYSNELQIPRSVRAGVSIEF
jgi:hypothetical protein